MLDVVKISVKTALILGVIGALAVVLLAIQIPQVDFTTLSTYIGHVYAFAVHWCPIIARLWSVALVMIGVNLGLLTFKAGCLVFKMIMKIFE